MKLGKKWQDREWDELTREEKLQCLDEFQAELNKVMEWMEREGNEPLKRYGVPFRIGIEAYIVFDQNNDPRLGD